MTDPAPTPLEEAIPEGLAALILATALAANEAARLLGCLFEGGSVTHDRVTGRNVYATADQLDRLMRVSAVSIDPGRAEPPVHLHLTPTTESYCGEVRAGGSLVVAGHCGTLLQADGRCSVHGYPAHIIQRTMLHDGHADRWLDGHEHG